MAATNYRRGSPTQDLRRYTPEELRRIEIAINSLVELLATVGVPIEVGAADSGGVGYRVLRIPN